MAAEKPPHGIGRQMDDRLAARLLHRGSLRAWRQSRQQRAAAADRGAQIGGSEGCDSVVTGDQKRFGLGARQRGGEHLGMLFAGD